MHVQEFFVYFYHKHLVNKSYTYYIVNNKIKQN